MITFYIIIGLFIPLFIVLVDFILKSSYILYWDIIHRNRLDIFVESLKMGLVTIRRVSIDGNYILNAKSYDTLSERPLEFIGDNKGNISVIGTKLRIVKPLIGIRLFSPLSIKIVNNKKLKDNYVELINDFTPEGITNNERLYGPLVLKPIDNTKLVLNNSVKNNSYKLKKDIEDSVNFDDNEVRKLAINTFNRRKIESEFDLYEKVHFGNYIRECVNRNLKTESEMNKLIVELIYNSVYG